MRVKSHIKLVRIAFK